MLVKRVLREPGKSGKTMNGKATLKRLEISAARRTPAALADYERAKASSMTDEELVRDLAAFARVLRLMEEDDEAEKLEGLVAEWTNEA